MAEGGEKPRETRRGGKSPCPILTRPFVFSRVFGKFELDLIGFPSGQRGWEVRNGALTTWIDAWMTGWPVEMVHVV